MPRRNQILLEVCDARTTARSRGYPRGRPTGLDNCQARLCIAAASSAAQGGRQDPRAAQPEVDCISKGRARVRYEFGCKVSFTTTTLDEGSERQQSYGCSGVEIDAGQQNYLISRAFHFAVRF